MHAYASVDYCHFVCEDKERIIMSCQNLGDIQIGGSLESKFHAFETDY